MTDERIVHPFIRAIEDLPTRFPELQNADQLAQIATLIVIPNLKIAAKRDPEAMRAATVTFLRRFVIGLGIAPQEIYGPAEIGAARVALEATPDQAPAEPVAQVVEVAPVAPDARLAAVLAGEDD